MKLLTKPWPRCRMLSLSVLTVLTFSGMPLAFADDDLGVTMRMVTDEDVTRSVTREISLPPSVPEAEPAASGSPGDDNDSPGNSNSERSGARGSEGLGPTDGPPGLQGPAKGRDADRARPSGPPERVRDRIPGSPRGSGPGDVRDRGPDNGRPDNRGRGRPDNPGGGRPDNPGRGNRPGKP